MSKAKGGQEHSLSALECKGQNIPTSHPACLPYQTHMLCEGWLASVQLRLPLTPDQTTSTCRLTLWSRATRELFGVSGRCGNSKLRRIFRLWFNDHSWENRCHHSELLCKAPLKSHNNLSNLSLLRWQKSTSVAVWFMKQSPYERQYLIQKDSERNSPSTATLDSTQSFSSGWK